MESRIRESPTGDSLREIFGMLILAEDSLWGDPIDGAAGGFEQRSNIAAVFAVIDLDQLFPHGAVGHSLGCALEDDSLIGLFCANSATRVGREVFRFACTRPGAEPESILPPDSPDNHKMRAPIGPGSGDPIVMRFFEAFEGPGPWLETGGRLDRLAKRIGPIGMSGFRFEHNAPAGESKTF
jgi:hypothetical protein